MRLAADLRPVIARTLRASRGIGKGRHDQIAATPVSCRDSPSAPVGATALGPFREVFRKLVGKDADAACLGLGALLMVEQLAGVLTEAQPIGAPVRTAGSGRRSCRRLRGYRRARCIPGL
jgi:hypothetical protein